MSFFEDGHNVFAFFSIALGILAYIPYLRDISRGSTQPHAFSWLVWALVMSIASYAQYQDNAGPGMWTTVLGACITLYVFVVSLLQKKIEATTFDTACLCLALFALPLWILTDTPLYSVIIVTFVDVLGFLPTFRKSYALPYAETVSTFFLGGLSWVLAIGALHHISIVTCLYPAALAVMHLGLAAFLLFRRTQDIHQE